MENINRNILRIGDIVLTSGISPLAIAIKIKTAGIKYAFSRKIANHAGIVWSIDGSNDPSCLFMVEMGKTIEMTSFQEYEDNKYGSQIIKILRHKVFDSEDEQRILNNCIRDDLQQVKKYDYKGILEFIWPSINDRPDNFYCSELVRHYIQGAGADIESCCCGKDDDISPFGIQIATNLETIWSRF